MGLKNLHTQLKSLTTPEGRIQKSENYDEKMSCIIQAKGQLWYKVEG